MSESLLLRFPARLEYKEVGLRAATVACRRFLRAEARGAAESAIVHAIVSALAEALNNVALHAYTERVGQVEIALEFEPARAVLEVRDWGEGFEAEAVPPPDLAALPESGMGLFIIRAFMDSVSYRRGVPNVLRLEKRLSS